MVFIDWKNDKITKEFRESHARELEDITKMSAPMLCTALTYCKSRRNSIAEELVSRVEGLKEQYQRAYTTERTREVVHKAARNFGILLG